MQLPGQGGRFVDPSRNLVLVQAGREILSRLSELPGGFGPTDETDDLGGGPLDETFISGLHRLGVDTTGLAPFYYKYPVPKIESLYSAMPHQLETAAFLSVHPRAYCTSTMRTGKTAAVVMALDYIRRFKDSASALIVAPVSVMRGVWLETIRTTLPWAAVSVVHGGTGKAARLRILRQGAEYYIINYEGLVMLEPELGHMIRDGAIGTVVFDELTHYGNPDSQRWKAAHKIVNGDQRCPRVWGLTGTPGGNTEAVYGYCSLVNPERLPYKRRTSWQDATRYRFGPHAWQWRDRPEAPYLIQQVMQPCIRYDKADVLKNLPPVVKIRREAELSKDQLKACKDLKAELLTRTRAGEVIEVQQQAAIIGKLFQIALGVAIGGRGLVRLDARRRLETLEEIILESDRKTVIFRAFTGSIDDLTEWLNQKKISAAKVDGSVSGAARSKIFSDFQHQANPRVLVAHPQTVAYGVELAAADQLIFDGPPLSGVHAYLQAIERPLSAKQTAEKVSIIQLSSLDEEREFFTALDSKRGQAETVAGLFARMIRS